ncbi:heme-binding protein [Halomicrobium sp. IBSBa]|uniref:heme-binding protein n=1 Tax=Halomicrobium sp. IBSBa TaxID=2778916 RepID=UPI001ABEFE64|nr:heme-binding protein [Halomicrobium sp. IBSBa]MBO4248020.1 heme-binding protein [Halomicrobium sp. IBSBa]
MGSFLRIEAVATVMKREPPQTEEGWYVLHDLRHVDWDAWRAAPERDRDRALTDGIDYLEYFEAVEDSSEGQSAVYTVLGDKADLMILHLRPTMADLDAAERQFEQTEFARYTEQATSYVSVTEASGYTEKAREYFEGEVDDDSGLAQYIQARLHPDIPDEEFVCFYPMSKRREPDQNWYDLPFAERAEHIKRHGDIGRQYGGKVEQMIAGSIGFDDHEWGITLWSDDMTHVKDLLTQMRFDPSTSKFADFGRFYVGRRFAPSDLPAMMNGQPVPAEGTNAPGATTDGHARPADGDHPGTRETATAGQSGDAGSHGGVHPGSSAEGDHPHDGGEVANQDDASETDDDGHPGSSGRPSPGETTYEDVDDLTQRLATMGLSEGEDYDAGDYGLLFYSESDAEALADEVADLRESFDHYDRHVATTVRAQSGRAAVVSIWTAQEAAETAAGFLGDVSGVDDTYGGHLGDGADDEPEPTTANSSEEIQQQLADANVYAGQPNGEDVFALVLYSEADPETLSTEVAELTESFDHYDTHEGTAVYEAGEPLDAATADADQPQAAVVSLWETQSAADTASGFLTDLPGIVGRPDEGDGFGTMGMFYTVEPDHREEFVETFDEVGELLDEMDGHRETTLLANRDDENDMFIASQWDSKEDAMAFFRSDEFAETVQWGRTVLADRPRHVFLA